MMVQFEDVVPLAGEALAQHQEMVLNGVREHLEQRGNPAGLERFLAGSKEFGRGLSSAEDFINLLVELFDQEKGLHIVPMLAKLIRSDERRTSLLKCAASWHKPAGEEPLELTDSIALQPARGTTSTQSEAEEHPSVAEELTRDADTTYAAVSVPEDLAGDSCRNYVVTLPAEDAAQESSTATEVPMLHFKAQMVTPAEAEEPAPMLEISLEEASPLTPLDEAILDAQEEVVGADGDEANVLADFVGGESWQLAVCEGDRLRVLSKGNDGWAEVLSSEGGRGFVPTSFLEPTAEAVERADRRRTISKSIRARLGKSLYLRVAAPTRAYACGQMEAAKLREELESLVGLDEARAVGQQVAPLILDKSRRRFLEEGLEDDWIERLRLAKLRDEPDCDVAADPFTTENESDPFSGPPDSTSSFARPPRDEHLTQTNRLDPPRASAHAHTNPFGPDESSPAVGSRTSNPFGQTPDAPAHYDEREILLSRSHGVGAYNPETIERLQRLREDEELAARLQREEDEAAAGGRRVDDNAILEQQHYRQPTRDDTDASLWSSLFGPEPQRSGSPPESSVSVSGAGVWNSIFGAQSNEPASRSRQELDDERLARQLQAEEERVARLRPASPAVFQPPLSPAPPNPPLEHPEIGLFRCGACSETMHVRNALPGAQFSCPICGRVNTI